MPRLAPFVLAAALSSAAVAQGSPMAAITAYNAGINAIEKAGGSVASRTAKFEPLVTKTYDMQAIAGLVAGPAWAQAAAADKARAVTALTHHSAVSLAKNFKGPGQTSFVVDPRVIARGGDQVVKVTAGGSDILYYRMRGGRIIDVISGGVSQLALQRADLATTVAAGGVPAMTKKLGELDARP